MLTEIPFWVYIIVIVVVEILATIWYRSSVKRGKEEKVSISFEKITYFSALFFGAVGIAGLLVFAAILGMY